MDAVIIEFAGGKFFAAAAMHHGGLAYHVARSAKQIPRGFGNCRAAGRTQADCRFAFDKRFGIAVATRIPARAAVGAGEQFTYRFYPFVFGDSH